VLTCLCTIHVKHEIISPVLGPCKSTVKIVHLQVVALMCTHPIACNQGKGPPPLQVQLPPNLQGLLARKWCAALAAAAVDHVLPRLSYFPAGVKGQ
jgi:hypothetical protein